MNTQLEENEVVIKEGPANLQRGIEAVGGYVYLTSQRLVFESHQFNVQNGPTAIPLSDVVAVDKCRTKFLGLIPVFPNSISVSTNDGNTRKYVLSGRDAWIAAINGAVGDLSSS